MALYPLPEFPTPDPRCEECGGDGFYFLDRELTECPCWHPDAMTCRQCFSKMMPSKAVGTDSRAFCSEDCWQRWEEDEEINRAEARGDAQREDGW